jgi:aminoglycoside phosphotransferase (APT) family kinase protein
VINNPEEITAEWLTDILREGGILQRGCVDSIRVVSESSYSSTIGRLTVTYSDYTPPTVPTRLFLKICKSGLDDRVVGNERRQNEVRFHNEIASLMSNPPVAKCYHAVYSDKTGSSLLIFKDAAETHYQIDYFPHPSSNQAEKVIDAFAEIHSFWRDHRSLGDYSFWFPDQETVIEQINSTREVFPRFADVLGDRLSPSQRLMFEKTLTILPKLEERLNRPGNLTFIHGDPNWGNVLLPRDLKTGKALIIDWQLVRVGSAAEDLAFLITLFWDRESRQIMEKDILKRYHQGLERYGVENYGWTEFWDDYRLAVVSGMLFTPMWFWATGSSEEWWESSFYRVMQACEDLDCMALLES